MTCLQSELAARAALQGRLTADVGELGIELDEEAVRAHPYETGGRLHLEMRQNPLPSDNAKRITDLEP